MGTVYPASVLNTSAVLPVMAVTSSSNVVSVAAAVYSFTLKRQQLSFFYQIADWQYATADSVTRYTVSVLISWVSKGSFGAVISTPTRPPPNQAVVFGSDTPSAEAAIVGLKEWNVPFIAYTTASLTGLSALPLYASGTSANFSMIILGSGIIAFSPTQWSQLYDYQETYGVRLVSLYGEPGKGTDVGFAAGAPVVTTGSLSASPVSPIASELAGLPALYSVSVDTAALGYIYPASILNSTLSTSVLSFSTTPASVAAAVSKFSSKREQLSFFYRIAGWQASTPGSVSNYTTAILISWVSKGAYGAQSTPVVVPALDQAIVFGIVYLHFVVDELSDTRVLCTSLTKFHTSHTQQRKAWLFLYSSNTAAAGNFSMIILGSGIIGFSTAQSAELGAYQSRYGARLVSLYDIPGFGSATGYTSNTGSAAGVFAVVLDSSSLIGSSDAGFLASFATSLDTTQFGGIYPGSIVKTASVVPVINFKNSAGSLTIAAAVYNFAPSQQQLSIFYQIAAWDMSSATTASLSGYTTDVMISWVSKGRYKRATGPVDPVIAHAAQIQTRALIIADGGGLEEYPQAILTSYGLAFNTRHVPEFSEYR
ncbi:hypothetical protein BDR26DRAFT_960492 [Obelidium mucronatum]|nr:hypothetical protein BDR26DRAFT_960492 [Obelidium mucronatum]